LPQRAWWLGTLNLSKDEVEGFKRYTEFAEAIDGKGLIVRAQMEVAPSTGMPHFQVVIKTPNPWRLQRLIAITPGVSWATGGAENPKAMLRYVEKVDTRAPDEFFTSIPHTISVGALINNQGKRTDVDKVYQWLQDEVASGAERHDILVGCAKHFPADYIRMSRGIQEWLAMAMPQYKHDVTSIAAWPHQRAVLDFLKSEPDNRTIHILLDPAGGSGKSMLLKMINLQHDKGALFLNGDMKDMCYLVAQCDKPEVVCVDFARSTPDAAWGSVMNLLEQIKNGVLMSGKYVPVSRQFKPPHVIVCCNRLPPGLMEMLSHDRPVFWHLRGPKRNGAGDIVKQYPFKVVKGWEEKPFPFQEFTVARSAAGGSRRPRVTARPGVRGRRGGSGRGDTLRGGGALGAPAAQAQAPSVVRVRREHGV